MREARPYLLCFGGKNKNMMMHNMVWSNEKALEFLELLQSEPSIWNPKLQSHKNRSAVNDAWRRIMQSLSFPVTYEELKKKKESLMGYYRIHLNKYKKTVKSGAGQNDIYSTNWFAFELMDSFLRPIYATQSVINTESPEENSTNETVEGSQNLSNLGPSTPTGNFSNSERESVSAINHRNSETFKRPHVQNQKSKTPPEIVHAKKQMDDAFERLQSITSRNTEKLDEYDHFAFMIASKIRKLQNPDDREVLMNSIQNLTFEFYMKNKQSTTPAQSVIQSRSSSSVQSSPIYYQHSDEGNTNSPQMQFRPENFTCEQIIPQDASSMPNFPQQSHTMTMTVPPVPSTISNETTSHRILSISESGLIRIVSNDTIVPGNKVI